MDRNREARRVTMAASANGLPSRRRHRSSLRDSPEEDGPVELHEPARLRDRGLNKERDRDRERLSRSKRRRNREDGGDDSSEESVNDEEEDDDDDGSGGAAAVRLLPPNPVAGVSNHHYQQHVSRRNFPPSAVVNDNKVIRPVQGMKPADEIICFSVPRKARSASTKRSHESWISGTGAGAEQIHRQASPSLSPAPLSPSSSNVPLRKKMKPNGPKHKPPKSSSNASSSNPEELEIEIAEVLFGLRTQSQTPSKKEVDSTKFDSNRQSTDAKSRVSSPNSASASASTSAAPQSSSLLPQNSCSSTVPLSAVAPKRKKPRQVSDNQGSVSARDSPISSTTVKLEMNQSPKIANLELARPENGDMQSLPFDFTGSQVGFLSSESSQPPGLGAELLAKEQLPVVASLPKSEPLVVKPEDNHDDSTVSKVNSASSDMGIQRGEKFEIDLMAPPPQLRSSPKRESENVDSAAVSEHKPVVESKADTHMKAMITQDKSEKSSKSDGDETIVEKSEMEKVNATSESHEREKSNGMLHKEISIDLQLNLEKPGRDNTESLLLSGNKSHPQVQKSQQPQLKVRKDEHPQTEKTALPSSLPLPMSLASWPGGLPPMGYVAPLQGVVSMNGSQVPTTPVQWSFSQPRPKRCATHCYIARNIQYLQQYTKMNSFWPAAAAGSASLFGVKPCNLNVGPSAELHGGTTNSVVHNSKGQGLAIFPGNVGKDKDASQPAATIADVQRRQQQILLQQALPSGAPPSNIMGPAFIFPFNQQQAAAAATAAASVRPGPMAKSPNAASSPASASASTSASANGSAAAAPTAAAVSFNYPNFPSSETQYLAVLQNNAYPYPIPAPTYRGTHPQPMPFFNGSFYTSQMIHPPQLQQSASQPQKIQQGPQNTSISSGSSPSQKQHHLQSQQQRSQGPGVNGGNGTGNLNTFPTLKAQATQSSQPHQARNLETEMGREDSPSTADSSRVSCGTVNVYGHNFAMPIHHQNFALVSSAPPLAGSSNGNNNQSENKQQQLLQQQGLKPGADSLPQTFAMSFSSFSGSGSTSGIGLSSLAQNHAVLQNLPEAARHNYQIMQAAAAAQQRKNFKVSEEGKNGGGGDSSSKDEEKKGLTGKSSVPSGQSIVFSRPDSTDPLVSSLPGTTVIDSSARSLNLVSTPQRGSRASISNAMGAVNSTSSQLQNQMQYQQQHMQQQMVQLQKQQQKQLQQQMAATRNKIPPTSNGSVYCDHLASSSPSATSKFPNAISNFPQSHVQNGVGNSSSQSSQWKSTARTDSQAQVSTISSLKNLSQQQTRPQQSHTQISFGSSLKPPTALQGQQGPIAHRSSSPPTGVSSPTASLSKSATGSPRTPSSNSQGNKAAYAQPSSLPSQQSKNMVSMPSLKSPSILGNPLNITSSNNVPKSPLQQQQQQQQLKQMAASQPQLFFSPAYMQTQSPHVIGTTSNNPTSATSGYYLQRHYPEKQQQQQGPPSTTSTGMLSLCVPLTQTGMSSSDAKTVAAASVSNLKGGGLPSQSIVHHPQFTVQSLGSFSFVHTVPAAVQVKPTEQKQPAGNRDSLTRK